MTRINTNVSSLLAQNVLGRSNANLQTSLTRLSTGLRINTGKDDPAGLIASENLRSDITAIRKAISNTDRANQVIATADSALGQVSSLLNDIRGLVTESANAGALSDEQIAANQLQVDSSLEALNRIAQTTTFQGRRLLDGSLDFVTSAGSGFSNVKDLKIDQANLGANGQVDVSIDISSAASKALVTNGGIATAVPGAQASGELTFGDIATASAGTIDINLNAKQSSGIIEFEHLQTTSAGTVNIALVEQQQSETFTFADAASSFGITALNNGAADGAVGAINGGFTLNFVQDGTVGGGVNGAAIYTAGTNTITVNADFAGGVTDGAISTAIAAINGGTTFTTTNQSGVVALSGADAGGGQTSAPLDIAVVGRDASTQSITLTGVGGTAGNATFGFAEVANGGAGNGVAIVNNGGGGYTIQLDTDYVGGITIENIRAAIEGTAEIATATYGGSSAYFTAADSAPVGTQSATGGTLGFTDTFTVAAKAGGEAAGATGSLSGGVDIILYESNATAGGIDAAQTNYNATTNTISLYGDFASGNLSISEIAAGIAAIGGGDDFAVSNVTGGAATRFVSSADLQTFSNALTGGRDASTEEIAITGEVGSISNFSITFQEAALGGGGTGVGVVANGGGSYTIRLDTHSNFAETGIAISDIAAAIQGIGAGAVVNLASFTASDATNAHYFAATDSPTPGAQAITGGKDTADDIITVTADNESSAPNGVTVTFLEAASHGAPTAAINGLGNIVVTVDTTASTSLAAIASAINGLTGYSASVTDDSGDGLYTNGVDNSVNGTLGLGATGTGGLDSDIVFEISGATGAEVLSFGAGTSINQLVAGINAVSDATGVEAQNSGGTLQLNSTIYGSKGLVSVNIVSGDDNGTFADNLSTSRANGTDIQASINGIQASGTGNTLSVNTATLDLSLTVAEGSSTDINFTITGGGALFQLGPDVVSNQQARLGIGSVNTARLGGVSGKLFQLGNGGTAALANDPNVAAEIVSEAIDQVTSLRGRLGAFQRTTLETNKQALNDTLVNLTDAESTIRDADFATESANLTRAQILVQSGTTVLAIANQNPQNVLGLLR